MQSQTAGCLDLIDSLSVRAFQIHRFNDRLNILKYEDSA